MYQILIVEDEHRLAAFVEKGLRKNGFMTQVAPDGQQALEEVQSQSFDLMILDLGLPKVDGWSLLKQLRELGNTLPVVVMTATTDVRDQVLQAGANAYLAKPFRFQELLDSVNRHLN